MKKITTLLIFPILIFAFTTKNDFYGFKIVDGGLIWESVYNYDSNTNIVSNIKMSGNLKNINEGENYLSGEFYNLMADYKGAGFKRMVTPIYLLSNSFAGNVIIRIKEDKYKVTIKDISMVKLVTDMISKEGFRTSLDDMATKKNDYRVMFKRDAGIILDYTFERYFDFSDIVGEDDF
jgi:hypothetical protein